MHLHVVVCSWSLKALATAFLVLVASLAGAVEPKPAPRPAKVYAIVTAHIAPGKFPEFVKIMKAVTPVLAKHGVRLLASYVVTFGRLDKVVDIWDGADAETIYNVFNDPEVAQFDFSSIVAEETTEFAELSPIPQLWLQTR